MIGQEEMKHDTDTTHAVILKVIHICTAATTADWIMHRVHSLKASSSWKHVDFRHLPSWQNLYVHEECLWYAVLVLYTVHFRYVGVRVGNSTCCFLYISFRFLACPVRGGDVIYGACRGIGGGRPWETLEVGALSCSLDCTLVGRGSWKCK